MRRADRLFRLVELLRLRHMLTARQLAEALEVSERTIYRDVADLQRQGVPIRGEAGIGYAVDPGYDLPPLQFTVDELEALVLGARMVQTWCGKDLAGAARDAVARIELALPRRQRDRVERTALYVPDIGWTLPGARQMAELREAIREQRKIQMKYIDLQERPSERIVWPLGLFFWGRKATLGAYCELREDFRSFRPDRIDSLEVLAETFVAEPGRTLQDYLRRASEQDRPFP
ncbi:MAG: YafY family transcriptional regulator [Acidobacteria bacterium]|jgi:predicted DNA-binding transcriptional regulator YafY|nr:YafY family transcriptional regulator [Acidobacteriota bacterium]